MAKTQTKAAPKLKGVPADEAIEDFRLACISRAIDDREIALQRQSKAFFQISGAGHEALYLGLARYLRPGYDWFFPYYRDGALMLGLGVSAKDLLLQAVGSADDPCVRRTADAVPLELPRAEHRHASRRRRGASASRPSGAPKRRGTSSEAATCRGAPRTATSSRTSRSAKARARRASSGSR